MSKLYDLLQAHPDWISPRSDQHTVIGIPNSRDTRKTFVEPGGGFSPGVATFGVSCWIFDHTQQKLYAPEEYALEDLTWRWENGYLPILNSSWSAGVVQINQQLFAAQLSSLENIVNTLQISVINQGALTQDISLLIVLRPYGPAGGKVFSLALEESGGIAINGKTVLLPEFAPTHFGAISFQHDQGEISALLRTGNIPAQAAAKDADGLCSGVLAYRQHIQPAQQHTLSFDFFVHPLEEHYKAQFNAYHAQNHDYKLAAVKTWWHTLLHGVELSLPDQRFHDAYYAMLAQMLVATVQHEVRIATITYPLFWLRDGVYLINALDKAGLHREVKQHLEILQDGIFAGGFGAEPDAFGEGIWAFLTHYHLTHDHIWLAEVYPAVQKRAEWIIKARSTQEYLYADTPARVPANLYTADSDLICEPARDGLIQGRMDWHRPLIWINAFSYLGLTGMVELARALGIEADAQRYQREAKSLREALHRYSKDHFGENERDVVCALWPTGAFSADDPIILTQFERWWQEVRLRGKDTYTPEPLWKYFELGQAHNYLYLGQRERALQTIEHYLTHHDTTNLFGWLEDDHDIAEHWQHIEGWYAQPARLPHGWVAAEFFLLLRDLLAYEQDQTLVIGHGIPASWLSNGQTTKITHMPTRFGPVSIQIEPSATSIQVQVHFQQQEHVPEQIALCLPWSETARPSIGTVSENHILVSRDAYQHNGLMLLTITR